MAKSPHFSEQAFVPALGRAELTSSYDRVIAIMTRERRWRRLLLDVLQPRAGETILDIGAGTGSQAILLKQHCHQARILATDPDPEALRLARDKAERVGVEISFHCVMGDRLADVVPPGSVDAVISSLVLHQCPLEVKAAILKAAWLMLRPGGRIVIADYGFQPTPLMRILFQQVQRLDGFDNTQPNAEGILETLIPEAGFSYVREWRRLPTPSGSISLYSAAKEPSERTD